MNLSYNLNLIYSIKINYLRLKMLFELKMEAIPPFSAELNIELKIE